MADDSISLREYVDAQIQFMEKEIERRFETHRQMHEMDVKTADTFKEELAIWKAHANNERERSDKERATFMTRKEIILVLAAFGGFLTTMMAVVYFIVYAVRGGH